jgi:hypothetical protein
MVYHASVQSYNTDLVNKEKDGELSCKRAARAAKE